MLGAGVFHGGIQLREGAQARYFTAQGLGQRGADTQDQLFAIDLRQQGIQGGRQGLGRLQGEEQVTGVGRHRGGKQTLLERHDRLILGKNRNATAPVGPLQRGIQPRWPLR
ncbi:hypothetical protein D3C77_628930 [compost metagenome]